MKNTIHFLICTFVLINPYSCWVIDPKMLDVTMLDELNGIDIDEMENRILFPGTKWCGEGTSSTDYNDLGFAHEADACCRAHDHCPSVITAGETKYNLTNTADYTRLSCKCDRKLYKCLQAADTITAGMVGKIYFNYLGTQCFRKSHPATCLKKTSIGAFVRNTKCIKYSYDKTKKKLYQWFDVKTFY